LITAIERPAGVILTVTENRNWIEVFFEGDLMAHRRGQFAGGAAFQLYVEEIHRFFIRTATGSIHHTRAQSTSIRAR
jgi:hypothetical protein